MADAPEPQPKMGYRNILALTVLLFSIVAVATLGVTTLLQDKTQTTLVFSALLPLLGSWVGTILAYYFSKENFEAATRSVTELARTVSPFEKLQSIPVKDKMILKKDIYFEIEDKTKLLKDILSTLDTSKKGNRIPFANSADRPLYVIHRSALDKFLTREALAGKDPKVLTLQDFLNDPELQKKMDASFTSVRENATLADAKKALDDARARGEYCQDVFVTTSGKRDEAMVGWITNVILEENSKV